MFVLLSVSFFSILPAAHAQKLDFYFEAIAEIQKKALYAEPTTRQEDIVRDTLKAYLQSMDPFSEYWSPEEYAMFKEHQKGHYAGIGLGLERTPSGKILCIPYADSPAEEAGVKFGDLLETINGIQISGKSLLEIGNLARGEEGTELVLTIVRENQPQEIRVTSQRIRSDTVHVDHKDGIPILRLSSFTSTTQRELRIALSRIKDSSIFILDLRGNPGGDLYSAIDAAMLFLDTDEKIVTIQDRNYEPLNIYRSTTAPFNSSSRLFLWQDERTASAAEVFIAALTQNKRAESVGNTSYGKGIKQSIIELTDGSALKLSTAYLQTPDGTLYHGQGLEPTHALETSSPQTQDYLGKTDQLLRSTSPSPISQTIRTPTPENTPISTSTPAVNSLPQHISATTYFICFDTIYNTEEEAQIRSQVVQRSFDDPPDQYLLQRHSNAGIKFMICLGTFPTKEDAEQKRLKISEAMGFPMFIKVLAPPQESAKEPMTTKSQDTPEKLIRSEDSLP